MSSYEATFWIILVAGLVLMGAAWQAVRLTVRWRRQRENYQAVLRRLHEQGHPHTHLWKNAGFIDAHPIETCWICGVEKSFGEGEGD